MAISSDAEFYLVIGKAVGNAIDEVIEKIYQELQNAIEQDIYSAYSPQDYGRIGELVNAWRHEASGLSGEVKFEPSMLSSDPGGFHHNSPYGWDVRAQIFDILEGGYGAYNAKKGKPIPSRPMWDEFLAKVDSKFDKWFRSALRHQGLVVV
jgi:hypothetical protein